ncbi:MAG: hypothetical protein RLZ59_1911 [Pseudomonadota bacterium]|jgi:uncharacterized membrane protein
MPLENEQSREQSRRHQVTPSLASALERKSGSSPVTKHFIALTAGGTLLFTLILLVIGLSQRVEANYQTPRWAIALHLSTTLPALLIGCILFLNPKGTLLHKALGRIWAALMMTTAFASIWIRDLTGGFGPIHIFTLITLVSIPYAIWSAVRGDIEAHQRSMMGTFIGLVIAGAFSLMPGRLLGSFIWSIG